MNNVSEICQQILLMQPQLERMLIKNDQLQSSNLIQDNLVVADNNILWFDDGDNAVE